MKFQETETVELKTVAQDGIKKEIVAFANSNGGTVYVGVGDDGTVLGVEDADGCALQVSNMVRDAVRPDITMFVSYETLDCDGKAVVCVLSSSRRQNRRYDFDTFGVSRADLFFYSRDLPSISAFSILLLAPPNSTSLPWCMMRSMMAEASLSSPNTTPHLLNSIFVVITRLRFS